MGFRMGIVGLPNVGKSTLFNALTRTAAAQAANFPFCTIEPNVGEVAVPDARLDVLAGIAAQLGITLQNSKLYDRMKERDRLAALGQMAAGLAHEIRNPLGAIKGAAEFVAPLPDGTIPDDAAEDVAMQSLLKTAVERSDTQVPDLVAGVQRKLRKRSRGKFYADGWSTAASRTGYAVVAVAMLLILAVAYLVLGPTGISVR